MRLVIIFLVCLFFINTNSIIKASLQITKYDPLSFQLTFSQQIPLPSFQILVDSTNLPYFVYNDNITSSVYSIQVTNNYQDVDKQNTQAFYLVFNYPLEVANGQLYISNYVLSPVKADLYITMSTWPIYLMFTLLCACSVFSIISLSVIDFIQLYILTQIKFHNKTSLIEAYRRLFFFDHNFDSEIESNGPDYLIKLVRPNFILLAFFIIGLIVKLLSRFIKNPFFKKRIVKLFAYDIFLSVWTIILPSIIYKTFDFLTDAINNILQITQKQYIAGFIFTHLNFISFTAYFYILYFVINPKINQDNQSYVKYIFSSQFQLYSKFHKGLHLSQFVKRNTVFFLCLRKLIVVLLSFISDNIAPYVLFLQMVACFFIFTVRPYKEWYYTNVFIVLNLIWFFYYIMVLQGFFYFDISNILQTRLSLNSYLLSKSIIFHIICFLGFVASAIEGYRLFKSLKYEYYQDQQVKQKIKPVKANRNRLYTQTSDKIINDMKQSLIFENPMSPDGKRKKRQNSNSIKQKGGKIKLFQIQMEDLSPAIVNRKLSTRIKKKWKDKSLLQQLATN